MLLKRILVALAGLVAGVFQVFGAILAIAAVGVLVAAPLALANLPPPLMVTTAVLTAVLAACVVAALIVWLAEAGVGAKPHKWPIALTAWIVPSMTTLYGELDHYLSRTAWAIGSARSRLPWGSWGLKGWLSTLSPQEGRGWVMPSVA